MFQKEACTLPSIAERPRQETFPSFVTRALHILPMSWDDPSVVMVSFGRDDAPRGEGCSDQSGGSSRRVVRDRGRSQEPAITVNIDGNTASPAQANEFSKQQYNAAPMTTCSCAVSTVRAREYEKKRDKRRQDKRRSREKMRRAKREETRGKRQEKREDERENERERDRDEKM